jgi:hypothetical protein
MTELKLDKRHPFTVPAIRCVLDQTYPETQTIWEEALTLMTGLSGVALDNQQGSDAILMGDYKAITVAQGAKEELEKQVSSMFPSSDVREMMLDQGAPLLICVA